MTATEKKYAKHIGQLFWSSRRSSLVIVLNLQKQWNRYRYNIRYLSPEIDSADRNRDAKDICKLIDTGSWMPAKRFLELAERMR